MRLIVVLIIGRSAKYCNLRVRVSACQSVSLSARISQKLHVHKVPWDARERRSCSSGYWQIALLRLQVRRNAHEERWAECYGNGCVRPNDNILCKIIVAGSRRRDLIINKTHVQIEKKKGKYGIDYSLASASDGPCRMAGGHAENGVPTPQIFHFNHCVHTSHTWRLWQATEVYGELSVIVVSGAS